MATMSYGQQRLWILNRIHPESDAYNVPLRIDIEGDLDATALQAALGDLIDRHEILRTTYPEGPDGAGQRILPVADAAPALPVSDVTPELLEELLPAFCRRPYDLRADPPVRAGLWRTGPKCHALVLVIHHIATDGVSTGPLCRDLSRAYDARRRGEAPAFQPLPVQYADFARWERETLGAEDDPGSLSAKQIAYWREQLAGLPAELALPTDRSRPERLSARGILITHEVDAHLHRKLSELARGHGLTLFSGLQATAAAFLTRMGAGTDIPLGSPVAGRPDEQLDDLVGFFVNSVVFRIDTSGDPSLSELLGRMRDVHLGALSNQEVPFERIVEALNPPRSLARHPLFQVALTLHSGGGDGALELPLARCSTSARMLNTDNAKFDLDIGVTEHFDGTAPAGLSVRMSFHADLFRTPIAKAIADSFAVFLAHAATSPDRPLGGLRVLDEHVRRNLLSDGAAGDDAPHVDTSAVVDALFRRQATSTPDAPALITEAGAISYRDLMSRVDALSLRLCDAGAGPGRVVPILLVRGIDMVVALLATLRTGAAYTLLDPDFPTGRLMKVIRQVGARLTVSQSSLAGRLGGAGGAVVICDDEGEPVDPPSVRDDVAAGRSPEDPACVLFTSGSTGEPKGIVVPHRAVIATLAGQDYAAFGPDQVFLQCSPVSWDGFSLELFGSLLFGGACVLQEGQRPDPALVAELVARHQITMLQVSASLFNFLADEHPETFESLRYVFTGGEPASVGHVAAVRSGNRCLQIGNGYGPAESMGFTTCHHVRGIDLEADAIPIGRPVRHKRAYVLDDRLQLVPPGVVGEVYLAGGGLAHGYLGDPAMSAVRFVADPYGRPGSRMYRTGDLARWSAGALDYRGRRDEQIKIRGFRVEPAEVNAAIAAQRGVRQVAVVAMDRGEGDKILVAYVVGDDVQPARLRHALKDVLPEYLIPTSFVAVAGLPLTATGKLDVAALPEPGVRISADRRDPENDVEKQLCAAYEEVLGVSGIGIDENFFDLGGHSLLAAKLANRIRATSGLQLDLVTVFRYPTVAELAEHLSRARPRSIRPKLRRMDRS